jgi:hypothetical protein
MWLGPALIPLDLERVAAINLCIKLANRAVMVMEAALKRDCRMVIALCAQIYLPLLQFMGRLETLRLAENGGPSAALDLREGSHLSAPPALQTIALQIARQQRLESAILSSSPLVPGDPGQFFRSGGSGVTPAPQDAYSANTLVTPYCPTNPLTQPSTPAVPQGPKLPVPNATTSLAATSTEHHNDPPTAGPQTLTIRIEQAQPPQFRQRNYNKDGFQSSDNSQYEQQLGQRQQKQQRQDFQQQFHRNRRQRRKGND